ncbi:hypothetical protein [Aneurinibacillus aneurinilyticus]|uniref:hypothetical protein n=1 Tax=Aneurinibacillus aneurinilyticus TaxID=1391 RepID=UPI003523FD58
MEERRCTRRRVPSSFSHKEETRPLCGAKAGPAKHLGITGRETKGRVCVPLWWPFPLWTIHTLGIHRWIINRRDKI